MSRKLAIEIFRYNPDKPEQQAYYQKFNVLEEEGLTVLKMLIYIQEKQDPTLFFDGVCRSNVCGSCAILINGKPRLACSTQTKDLPLKIRLDPLSYFPIIKDLATNKEKFFAELNKKVQAWVRNKKDFDPELENLISTKEQDLIYQADRCIECGICMEACLEAQNNFEYIGAAGLNKVYRYIIDPRDRRYKNDIPLLLYGEEGVFNCEAILGCRDFCPKEIDLPKHIARLRHKAIWQTIKNCWRKFFGNK